MKFSVITPTFNRSDLIERAIMSMVNQSYDNFEMIIVDDASTDNTDVVVSKYLNDKRIRYIKATQNGGVNKARNIGFENISADSNFVTFLDSDDEFLDDALEKMKNQISINSDINSFRFGVQDINQSIINNTKHCGKIANADYYIKNLLDIGEWVCVFNKNIIDEGFRYDENVRGFEILAYIKLSFKENVLFSDKIVRIYHTGHESMMKQKKTNQTINNAIKGYSILLTDFSWKIKKTNKKNYGMLCYILGYFYSISHPNKTNIYKAIGFTYKGFTANPINLRLIRNSTNLIFLFYKYLIK